ncbi:hypothetical protein [Chryseobacterium sp. JUb7]|uniref:hypothetical protein n=1 Tax=Chryseobacterium sp. JUb7 TaxID=2940599 RepID=UPI00216A8FB6|nr:hypothetical protein [Chryseobacterium sp. JUb7]MCS3533131.1 hypothetical protein [Chryseobacterium sp. JUb7]
MLKQPANILQKPISMVKNELRKTSGINELSKINPLKDIPLNIPATPQQAAIKAAKLAIKYAKKAIDLGR